ncbi:MAG: hypothetical protein JEZ04_04880 [Spirochaetales bacterium]|nr:hypothetical protein [Spirochaetales bacterium]
MITKGIKLFFAIGLVFYLILGFYLWISIDSIRDEELLTATASSENIQTAIESAYAVEKSFSSEHFAGKMDKMFSDNHRLTAVIIYTEADGPLYLRLKDSRILSSRPGVENGWSSGHPELILPTPGLEIFQSALYPDTESTIYLTSVYNLLNRGKFLPVLRNTLLAAICYLALTIIFLSANKEVRLEPPAEVTLKKEIETAPAQVQDEQPHLIPDGDASGLYSPTSGLVWERFLSPRLSAELKRAASFDQDSCLVYISVISPSGFVPYRNISELIIEHFTYRDLAFEAGRDTFCVIIPDKDLDEGLTDVEKFKKSIFSRFPDSAYRIYAGLTSRNSRLMSEKRMIQEAKSALSKAVSEPESITMSFRTDLNKYREYIASTI